MAMICARRRRCGSRERLEAINLDVAIERLANFLSGDRRFDAVSRIFRQRQW